MGNSLVFNSMPANVCCYAPFNSKVFWCATAWDQWCDGIGATWGQGPPGITIMEHQRTKLKILIEQLRTSQIFTVENQLRVTLRSAKEQLEELNRKINIFHQFFS